MVRKPAIFRYGKGARRMGKDQGNFQTASEYVYLQLRKQIFEKKLQRGQRLPEIAIAKELEVSRTPVREAIRRLASEGLVQIHPNWGAVLVSPTRQEVLDTFEVRKTLEIMAVRKAAHKITPIQLCRLEECINAEMGTFADRDLETYIRINDEFHLVIAESSGNATLMDVLKNILARTFVQMLFFESFFDFGTNPSLDEHIEIYKALCQRDEQLCVELMEKHIDVSLSALNIDS